MQTTIDAAGRIVIPKSVREAAGLQPDVPVDVVYRDGHVEIAPVPRQVAIAKVGRVAVARAAGPSEPLRASTVEKTRRQLRER